MGVSDRYDAFEDLGLVFTEEEVNGYRLEEVANLRVAKLLDRAMVAGAILTMSDPPAPTFWKKVREVCLDAAGWMAYASQVPGVDRAEEGRKVRETIENEDSLRSAEMKEKREGDPAGYRSLMSRAHRAADDPVGWSQSWGADVQMAMRRHVTLSRRAWGNRTTSGWKRSDVKMSNRITNAFVREQDRFVVVLRMAESLSK